MSEWQQIGIYPSVGQTYFGKAVASVEANFFVPFDPDPADKMRIFFLVPLGANIGLEFKCVSGATGNKRQEKLYLNV